jgi:hypothetical protein
MSDKQISDLFAEGTAPERDPAFELKVASTIGRARFRSRLLALVLPATGVLVASGALYGTASLIQPVLGQLLDESLQFMGVPAPVVLGVLAAGLVLSARRYVLSR